MSKITFSLNNWKLTGCSSHAGYKNENNAFDVVITMNGNVDGYAFTLDMMGGGDVVSAVMVKTDIGLSYTLNRSITKHSEVMAQLVAVKGEEVHKTNIVKLVFGESINATEAVTPEETNAFEQALASYADQLQRAETAAQNATEAIQNSQDVVRNAQDAVQNAERVAKTASEAAGTANEAANKIKEELGKAVKSVNGRTPDANGNVNVEGGGGEVTKEVIDTALGMDVPTEVNSLKTGFANQSVAINGKIDKPETAPTVGKVLKVKAVNEDGSFVCEWADEENDGAVTDVKIGDNSIVQDGVANIPVNQSGVPSTFKIDAVSNSGGLTIHPTRKNLQVSFAGGTAISRRYANYSIDAGQFDYAFKAAMSAPIGTLGFYDNAYHFPAWTDAEKTAAQERLGILSTEGVSF